MKAGTLTDRYHIERELGGGGMASVYLARDLKHDRLVAAKVLHPELAAYLGTRGDIDKTKLAYPGFSWGGRLGGVILAIESRFKAAVLTVAGFNFRTAQPEVDDLNYLPRVETPVLMLNGRHDNTFPLETAAKPDVRFTRHTF